jgi:hypothetical protein
MHIYESASTYKINRDNFTKITANITQKTSETTTAQTSTTLTLPPAPK